MLLALLTGPAHADNSRDGNLFVAAGSGLMCFSIRPTDHRATCDALCADKHAACTAMTQNLNPPLSCADKILDPASTICRCCALAR
jgi:hypothetical protein